MSNDDSESAVISRHLISRDADFRRMTADVFLPYLLGADFEVSILAASPNVVGQNLRLITENGTPRVNAGEINPSAEYSEVGRLRLNMAAAVNLANVMVSTLVAHGFVDPEVFQKTVSDALASRSTSSEEGGEQSPLGQ